MPISKKQIRNLKIGSVYEIAHERKGHFVGQLIRIEELPPEDKEDQVSLVFKYDVRHGTAQAGLNVTGKQKVRVSGLRPSLIVDLKQTGEDEWLQEVVVPEEEEPGEPSILKRLFGGGKG